MSTGFVAPTPLRESLQQVLVNLIDLSVAGKQAHWNVVGPNFRSLHLAFDDVVAIARTGADDIAERMRALQVLPDGRADTVAESSHLPAFPTGEIAGPAAADLMVAAIEAVVSNMRKIFDDVDDADPTSADMLNGLIHSLEQQAWFIGSTTRGD